MLSPFVRFTYFLLNTCTDANDLCCARVGFCCVSVSVFSFLTWARTSLPIIVFHSYCLHTKFGCSVKINNNCQIVRLQKDLFRIKWCLPHDNRMQIAWHLNKVRCLFRFLSLSRARARVRNVCALAWTRERWNEKNGISDVSANWCLLLIYSCCFGHKSQHTAMGFI